MFGVRAIGLDLADLSHRCRAYAARMNANAAFSHSTAAALWGIPLPRAIGEDDLHVTVPVGYRAPGGHGITGHQQRMLEADAIARDGLRVVTPAVAWAQLGEMVSPEDLVAAGEFVITGLPLERLPPLSSTEEIAAAHATRVGGPGSRRRTAALREIRAGAYSRPESLVRILLARVGLPEPLINTDIVDGRGRFIATPDLQWPEWRVALEYEGDHHREQTRFRRDIARIERLVDAGWVVVRVSASELYGNPRVIVNRVESRLRSRGWDGSIRLRRIAHFQP